MTLIDRLSKLDGPDDDVDAEIAMQVCGFTRTNLMEKYPDEKPLWEYFDQERNAIGRHGPMIPRYTASADAAIALAERVLPGWTFEHIGQDYIRSMGASDDLMPIGWTVEITDGLVVIQGQAPTFPLAICIALLRAKEASHGE